MLCKEGERLALRQETGRVYVVLAEQWFDFMPGAKACAVLAVILVSLS